jgi:PAS domain S-box-containing protein
VVPVGSFVPRFVWRSRRRARQQQAVAELSLQALTGADRDTLFRGAVATTAEGLGVEYASVLELQAGGTAVVLRAAFGWESGAEGMVAELQPSNPAARALGESGPVLVAYPGGHGRGAFLGAHGVESSAAMVILGAEEPFGVLGAHSTRRRAFDRNDLFFLRSVANVLAGAVAHERTIESTRRLAAIVESSLDAIVGCSPDGTVTSWNAAAETLFGYSPAEMIGRSITVLTPPERRGEVDSVNQLLKRGETVRQLETERVRKDGTRIEVASTVSPITDSSGKIVAVSAISRDVTERRVSEAALRESEARVRAVLESALDAVITIDHEGRILEFNPAAELMFGRRRTDAVGARMAELLIPPSLRDGHRRGFERFLATGEGPILGKRIELTALRADGSEFPIELAVSRVPLEGPPLFTGYVRDISERKLAEVQLRQSEERFRDLFENASEPIATVDLEGNLTEVNSAFENALGYTRRELIGTNLDRYLTPHARELSTVHRERKLSGEETASKYEQTFIGKGGRRVILDVSTRLIHEDGRPVGVQGTCRDITARKEDEAELRRLAELNRHQARHDQLTGLPNRAHLEERIEDALAPALPAARVSRCW